MNTSPFFSTQSNMPNLPKPNFDFNSNQVTSNPVMNPFSAMSNTAGNTINNTQPNPFKNIIPKPLEKQQDQSTLPFFPNNKINPSNLTSMNPFVGLTNTINASENHQSNNTEQKPAFNPFVTSTKNENQATQKEELNKSNPFTISNPNISKINPTTISEIPNSINEEKHEKEEESNELEKKSDNPPNNYNYPSESISITNPLGFPSEMTFGQNSIINEKSKIEDINTDTNNKDKSSLNNKGNNNIEIESNNRIDITNKEKGHSIKQNNENKNKGINGNKDKDKENEPKNILDSSLNNLSNAKIEDSFVKWKNDLDYQAEKYSICSERLKNYEMQFESEIESISILTNLIQSIQINSDETVSQLKEISSKEDELLSQLNFLDQSLQPYFQEISSNTKDQDNLYNEIAELSKKINHIGNTIDDINQRCEPHDDNNHGKRNSSGSSNIHNEEGEINKVLNEFYYELRKIEFAEQDLLCKLNSVEKDIDDKKIEIALKQKIHF